jgi:hypothetical protein
MSRGGTAVSVLLEKKFQPSVFCVAMAGTWSVQKAEFSKFLLLLEFLPASQASFHNKQWSGNLALTTQRNVEACSPKTSRTISHG